ncbi:MAG: 16S rRNA (guanine(527)-N(7))-methyltransferase RsmG [Bacteroidetes bacterium]|nr:16S rRNA (guanine(527)-N(7))-methyltransferase RsmG [Bacteroidota bacterium]MBU1677370.1 16S rRNA (guanine(527)-N(7))-methyltransferase RsmG [Bacteroidota bacterium]MBU2505581.1 16S rRNA (guanine(527)-N(7))-methyltransferase RsmG [Bacteroidota bacterium]
MNTQEKFLRELKNLFWENSLNPDIYQLERLARYANLLVEKNESINLISRKDAKNVIENHIFASAFLSEFLPDKVSNFVDIGTGGGLPGIPLAILNPLLHGVLVDSTNKKIDAVKGFLEDLKLSNVTAESFRVESNEFIEKYADSFDFVISRASVPLIILLRYAIPLIKEKAYVLSVKGGELDKEFRTAELKYKAYIKKSTVFELAYKPTNAKNEKGKRLIMLELSK